METNEKAPQARPFEPMSPQESIKPPQSRPQESIQPQTRPTPQGMGYLIVQVTTASSAIPLAGARVSIAENTPDRAEVLYELISGRDGRTERVSLPTVPRAASQSPSVTKPYLTYSITVNADGYGTTIYQNVPVFDGITAIQQANLIPTPENGYPDGFAIDSPRIFEGRDTSL